MDGWWQTRQFRDSVQRESAPLDGAAELISNLIGVNTLTEDETRNLLTILRSSLEMPESMLPSAREPSRTLLLLRHLKEITDGSTLKREIEETIAYFEAR
jgi:hypothetical protein